jgi:hypothetical protein
MGAITHDGGLRTSGSTDGSTQEARLGRASLIGAAVGWVVTSIVVFVVGVVFADLEAGAAIGLGLFVGMWGGGGFGFMMGATTSLAKDMAAHH